MGKLENPEKSSQSEEKDITCIRNLRQNISETLMKAYKSIPLPVYPYHTCAKLSLGDVKSCHQKCYKESNLDKPKPNDTHKSLQLDWASIKKYLQYTVILVSAWGQICAMFLARVGTQTAQSRGQCINIPIQLYIVLCAVLELYYIVERLISSHLLILYSLRVTYRFYSV